MNDAIVIAAVLGSLIYLVLRLRKKSGCGSDCGSSCAAKDIKKTDTDHPQKP